MKKKEYMEQLHKIKNENSFENKGEYMSISESLMLKSAFQVGWNLAIEITNGNEISIEEAFPVNYDKE